MIDSLIETVKQAEQKAGLKRPEFLLGSTGRMERLRYLTKEMTYDDWRDFRRDVLAVMSLYVSDPVWDYCLQEAIKPLEGSNEK